MLTLVAPARAQQMCGDLDNNGSITAVDALRLLQKATGVEVAVSCPGVEGGPFDATAILRGFAEETVFLTYKELANAAQRLREEILRLAQTTDVPNLESARSAWRATRRPWEQSEGFLFGPVDEAGLDPKLDSWPVNKIDLDNILDSGADLTDPLVIKLLDNNVKGLHTIEYLLFDDGTGTAGTDFIGKRDPASIVAALLSDSDRLDYLVGLSGNLLEATDELADSWDPDDGDFAAQISGAGKTSARYSTQKSALQEIIEGAAGIADEVANGKISAPFLQSDPKLVESQFSFNSLTDFTDNVTSIRNVYEGSNPQGCAADGLSAYVVTVDPDLDAAIRQEIADAIGAIQAISEPFRDSITDGGEAAAINAAIDAVNQIRRTFESDLFDLVVNDGEFAF